MTKQDAIELCKLYDVDPAQHPAIVVTANGNIYPDGNVDPGDTSVRIELNVEEQKAEVIDEPKPEHKPQHKRK